MIATALPHEYHHTSLTNINNASELYTMPNLFLPCNNPLNIVSPRVAETVDLVLFAGVCPVLVMWGIITNAINMAVFARQGLSDRINLCLFSLAVSDTGFLIFMMSSKSYALIGLLDPVLGNYWEKEHRGLVLASGLGSLATSNTITAIIAVERCLCVLSPLKAARIFKTKYMGIAILVAAVYILTVLNAAFTLQFQTVEIIDPITNSSTYISRQTPFYLRHRTVIDILYLIILMVFLPSLSLVVVIVCTIIIVIRLKTTDTWRREAVSNMAAVDKQSVTLTRMLVTMCIVFATCTTPTVIRSLVIVSGVPGFHISKYLCNLFKVLTALSHLLEVVNASSNFLIYVRQSSRYRSTLQRLFPRISKK